MRSYKCVVLRGGMLLRTLGTELRYVPTAGSRRTRPVGPYTHPPTVLALPYAPTRSPYAWGL
eukprot:416374-Rhodomonas_salina.1